MATSEVDFLAGSDLDELFALIDGGFLDNDEDLNNHIESVANEITSDEQSTEGFGVVNVIRCVRHNVV